MLEPRTGPGLVPKALGAGQTNSCHNLMVIMWCLFSFYLQAAQKCLRVGPTKGSRTFKAISSPISFCLQVPQLYKIKGYQPFSVQRSSRSYRPQKLARALRQGAEVICAHPQESPFLCPLVLGSRLTRCSWSWHRMKPPPSSPCQSRTPPLSALARPQS